MFCHETFHFLQLPVIERGNGKSSYILFTVVAVIFYDYFERTDDGILSRFPFIVIVAVSIYNNNLAAILAKLCNGCMSAVIKLSSRLKMIL